MTDTSSHFNDRMADFTARLNAVKLPGFEGTIARKMAEEIALAESEERLPFGGEDLETAKARLEEQYGWMKTSGLTPEDKAFLERLGNDPELLAQAFVTRDISPEERALEF